MTLALRWVSLAAFLWTGAAAAADWTRDVWHHVGPDSPFNDPDRPERHAAGLVQQDGRIAVIELGTPEQGALVSVSLPGPQISERLNSILEMPAGYALSRRVSGTQLVAAKAADSDEVSYTFRIDPADIELFMAARYWRLRLGEDETVTLTLKGSRKALSAALAARDAAAMPPPGDTD